jgi:hypothetical protein
VCHTGHTPRYGYSAGFLGGFAKDDSFLNRSHLAPEYFTKDSLNGGFNQRFKTRHGPLYHFWPGIPDRFCPLTQGCQPCPAGDIAAFPFREHSSNLTKRTGRLRASKQSCFHVHEMLWIFDDVAILLHRKNRHGSCRVAASWRSR